MIGVTATAARLCPSNDRDSTADENRSTFIFSNIVPQAPTLNRQSWRLLEEYCWSLVSQGNELYIIAGPSGKGGTGDNSTATSLAGGKLTVLAALWKVIVVLTIGSNDLSRINNQTRVIAVRMPNTNGAGDTKWNTFRTSIDAIEAETGLDLLSNLPVSVQQTGMFNEVCHFFRPSSMV
ncbi:DNA/RNA non-specific endonuclease [Spirosoma flavus]